MLQTILAILAVLSFALTFWRWSVSLRFPLHRRLVIQTSLPGVSVLKPLKGCDEQTKNCLKSWLEQKYPGPVQILFGVASDNDPVCEIVHQLLAEYPKTDAQLVICGSDLGANAKVSTLRQLEPAIRHDLVVISDADVSVRADFLVNVTPLFDDPGVGLVNCFYRLANPRSVAMQWEAIAVNSDFWSQVLQARSLKPVDFALGAVMALPLPQLKQLGGFAALSDYLADDYQLGRAVARGGKRIDFATVVVDCWETSTTWEQVWAHQLRWARTIRICQPVPFFMSILDNATLWPLLYLLSDCHHARAIWIAAACLIFRIDTALHQQYRLIKSSRHMLYWWLVPIKDLINVVIWAASFWGNRVLWRGDFYKILPDGKLAKEQF